MTTGGALPRRPSRSPAPVPLTSDEAAGHRLLTLLFDTASMAPEDVQKAVESAQKWVNEQMAPADLVAVASIGASLQILTDFTNNKDQVTSVLCAFSGADGMAFGAVDASTAATDDANNTATDDTTTVDASAQELDTFNNDVRLRALKTLADALAPIQQKKAIIYFSSGMQRSGTDNQVELRAAVNAAVRANVAIYPVDARGLQAVVPGGSARNASRGGVSAFSGSARRPAVHAACRAAGNAADARGRHGRHGVHRFERLRRSLQESREGHLVVLHPGLRQHEPGEGRPLPPDQHPSQEDGHRCEGGSA